MTKKSEKERLLNKGDSFEESDTHIKQPKLHYSELDKEKIKFEFGDKVHFINIINKTIKRNGIFVKSDKANTFILMEYDKEIHHYYWTPNVLKNLRKGWTK